MSSSSFALSRRASDSDPLTSLQHDLSRQTGHSDVEVQLIYLPLLYADKVIKERKTFLQDQQELEKIQKKKYLDFLDILLCAKVSDGNNNVNSQASVISRHTWLLLIIASPSYISSCLILSADSGAGSAEKKCQSRVCKGQYSVNE